MQRLNSTSGALAARGQLRIHSAPSALRTHIDWALADLLGSSVGWDWTPQILRAGTYKCTLTWRNRDGLAGEIASLLGSWHYVIFEVQMDSDTGGELFRYTPELGIHRAVTDLSGAVVVSENNIMTIMKNSFDEESLRAGLALIIGSEWDIELERFRGVNHQEISHLRAI